jgi:hypothetical protein
VSFRYSRRKRTSSKQLPNGQLIKAWLVPWIHADKGYIWQASFVVANSARQANNWVQKRRKPSALKLNTQLPGKEGISLQLFAMRQVRQWLVTLPPGDAVFVRCESANPTKQFSAWKKWFASKEDPRWITDEATKSFFFYKPMALESGKRLLTNGQDSSVL